MRVSGPALYAYSFLPIQPAPGTAGPAPHLSALWEAYGRLGMTGPVFPDRRASFPDSLPDSAPRYQILAGRGNEEGEGIYQAVLFARHDTVGIVASLAPSADDEGLGRWGELRQDWMGAVGAGALPAGILGETLAFVALAHVGPGESPARIPAELGDSVWKALSGTDLEMWQASFLTTEGFAIWEGADPWGRRIVAIVAPKDRERELDRFIWWSDPHDLAPLGRYLLNASKLEYEARVFPELRERMDAALRQVDGRLDRVLRENERLGAKRAVRLDDLLEAQAELLDSQQQSAGLIHALSRLRELQRTVQIADENMRMAAPQPHPGWTEAGDSPFARDQRQAGWLSGQIEHDLGYAQAVLDRAGSAQELTSLRLQQALDRHARLQNRVMLLQTTIWAALLAALGAVATLELTFDPPGRIRGPLLAFWVALALAFPTLAAHWHERYLLFDHLAAMGVGAAAAWLGVRFAWADSPWPVMAVLVLAGMAAARLLTRLHDHQGARSWLHRRLGRPRIRNDG